MRSSKGSNLWQNKISHLDALKERSHYTFVAIDIARRVTKFEPLWITEIGVAVLSPPFVTKSISPDALQYQTPQTFFEQNTVDSYWLPIKGTEQSDKCRDQYYLVDGQEVEFEQAKDTLVSMLQKIRYRSKKPLVLVGYNFTFELLTIDWHFSQIAQYFSHWVDLRDIVGQISDIQRPTMKDTLLTFGFFSKELAFRGKKGDHNAGNDAVHKLVVLVNLLRLSMEDTLHIQTEPKDTTALRRFWTKTSESPKVDYPYKATIRIEGRAVSSRDDSDWQSWLGMPVNRMGTTFAQLDEQTRKLDESTSNRNEAMKGTGKCMRWCDMDV
ncbi:uncharacterized protein GGS25DRAFT_527170 [Hypoxylon fragiforme]|uniref:uncharacterized protein n=1 Tax=Hypoxylon fragiforme TaxID=63214 RepID=UPI0020C5DBA6|nr:uncharacterized protein GGS25DRAFT_527170 [Hypoxylon fragiforme]KAI2614044.1 hypothetical protein GGS25DRAFT_527170 [Hypoxylon fragiforme]